MMRYHFKVVIPKFTNESQTLEGFDIITTSGKKFVNQSYVQMLNQIMLNEGYSLLIIGENDIHLFYKEEVIVNAELHQ